MKIEHTSHGKWNAKGVPHKGWSCTSVDDLGEPSHICEMCQTAEIRYAHYMDHPDYPDTLVVGCVCAERMEDDYVKPKEREHTMKRLAQRRKSWPERAWKTSGKGNPYINTEGFNLTIFPREQGFAVSVLRRGTERKQIGNKDFPTQLEAKNAALMAPAMGQDSPIGSGGMSDTQMSDERPITAPPSRISVLGIEEGARRELAERVGA